jgi:hypothetical protein
MLARSDCLPAVEPFGFAHRKLSFQTARGPRSAARTSCLGARADSAAVRCMYHHGVPINGLRSAD